MGYENNWNGYRSEVDRTLSHMHEYAVAACDLRMVH